MDRGTDGLRDRQIDRQMDRETDRPTEKLTLETKIKEPDSYLEEKNE